MTRPHDPDRRGGRAPSAGAGRARKRGGVASDVNVICGVAAVLAAFERRPAALRRLWLRRDLVPTLTTLTHALAEARLPFHVTSDDELERVAGTHRHQGVVATFAAPEALTPDAVLGRFRAGAPGLALYLDGVGNPHNLGAVARTAAHFGVDVIVQRGDEGAATLSPAAFRVAAGGLDAVPVVYVRRPLVALNALRDHGGAQLLATAGDGDVTLFAASAPALTRPTVWLLGEEREGLDADVLALADARVRIPGSGMVESVNVAAAAAVVLAETYRQRTADAKAPTVGQPTTTSTQRDRR